MLMLMPSGQVKQLSLEKEGLDSQLANNVQTCNKLQEAITQGEDARLSMHEKYSALQQVCVFVCARILSICMYVCLEYSLY